MSTLKFGRKLVAIASLLLACGSVTAASGPMYTVGGTITGLTGSGLRLRLNGSTGAAFNASPASGAVKFEFAAGLASGSAFTVTIEAQPSSPAQTCVIQEGSSGTIGIANVTSVAIACSANGAVIGRGPLPDSRRDYNWDVYVDAFSAHVNISGLHSSDGEGDCVMAGAAVNATFTESPDSIGKVVGGISWSGGHGYLSVEFYVDSDATVATQSGIKSPGIPLACSGDSAHFKNDSYRISGDLNALTGTASLTSSMPRNAYTADGFGCPPEGDTCSVRFWFDNSPGLARTTLDLDRIFRVGSVTLPIQGSATNAPNNSGGTRGGTFSWSGTVTLRIVATSAP